MIPPKITNLPPAPVRSDAPVDFSTKADAMVGALQPFANQANILAEFVNDRANDANVSASAVAGVQSAVSADRVLSQQAASNAAGSAAAALLSANNASGSAGAAQSSANASEASAVRAENAAEYVENITGGAAPINNPNFTGVVKVNNVPLGYAATAPTVGDGVGVMRVGAGGWMGRGIKTESALGYPSVLDDVSNQTKTIRSEVIDNGVSSFAAGIHFSSDDTWGRLRVGYLEPKAWIQGGLAGAGTGWTDQIVLSANMLQTTGASTDFPMSQKATTDAILAGAYENIHKNSAATGSVSLDLALATEFDIILTGNTTISFLNSSLPAGKSRSFVVRVGQGGTARALTWPSGITWLVIGPVTTPSANKICEYIFSYSAEAGWVGRLGASN